MTKITNIDEAYNLLVFKDFWEQPPIDICNKIVEFLNDYIKHNPNDARAYYLQSLL